MGLRLKGVAAANGIAIAPLVHFHGDLTFIPMRNLAPEEIAGEKDRLAEALGQAAEVIFQLRRELASDLRKVPDAIHYVIERRAAIQRW